MSLTVSDLTLRHFARHPEEAAKELVEDLPMLKAMALELLAMRVLEHEVRDGARGSGNDWFADQTSRRRVVAAIALVEEARLYP